MKKLLSLFLVFSLSLGMAGCTNSSIESKLKKNGFEVEIEDKTVTFQILDDQYYSFTYSLSESNEESFYFNTQATETRGTVISLIADHNLIVNDDGDECFIYKGTSGDNCTDEHMELLDEAEEKYNDFLNKLDITEKELYEYMKELYNENFI